MQRKLALIIAAALVPHSAAFGIDLPATRVVVTVEGLFSSNPDDILQGDPATFPLPSILGGSFSGTFAYRTDAAKSGSGLGNFPLSATSLDVFDNVGSRIHTIELPTAGAPSNPLKVGPGFLIFSLGPSCSCQAGHVARMPTDIRFVLENPVLTALNEAPPSAADLNAATLGSYFDYPLVALDDDVGASDGWVLAIVAMSFNAREVPEPSSVVALAAGAFAILTCCRQRRR